MLVELMEALWKTTESAVDIAMDFADPETVYGWI